MAGTSSSSLTARTGARTGIDLHDEGGRLFSLPAGWTDVAGADPFTVVAAGRAPFSTAGLLALADLVDRFRAQRDGAGAVKKIMP